MSPTQPRVTETPAASPEEARRHFAAKLSVETDPSDVAYDLEQGHAGSFVLLDARSAEAHAACRLPGALSLPHRTISPETVQHLPKDKVLVLYCWGPACNAATKAAAKLSALGFRVKEMLGGIEYWRREGYAVEGTKGAAAPLVG
jgi:rhodanese-related sulfurtransferase